MQFKSFHHWLRYHILKSELSVREFARMSKCGTTTLYRYLQGKILPHLDSYVKLCICVSKLTNRDINVVLIEAIQASQCLHNVEEQCNHGRKRIRLY